MRIFSFLFYNDNVILHQLQSADGGGEKGSRKRYGEGL